MEKSLLNKDWHICTTEEFIDYKTIPETAKEIQFPYDALPDTGRDFSVTNGHIGSYYASKVFYFYKELPLIDNAKKMLLDVSGLCGVADIFIEGQFVAHVTSTSSRMLDITQSYQAHSMLCVRIASHPDTGNYAGLGIADSVSLLYTTQDFYIAPMGVRIATKQTGEKAAFSVYVDVVNTANTPLINTIGIEIFNAKHKRIVKKNKSIRVPANATRTFEVTLKVSKGFTWTLDDPYLYTAQVTTGNQLSASVPFGIVRHEAAAGVYRKEGRVLKWRGTRLAQNNALLGRACRKDFEIRRATSLKNMGHNVVRFKGCPQPAALHALDAAGLLCVVDVFETLDAGTYSNGAHVHFANDWQTRLDTAIKTLRNHPCVAAYSVVDLADKHVILSANSHTYMQHIIKRIKELDPLKPIISDAEHPIEHTQPLHFASSNDAVSAMDELLKIPVFAGAWIGNGSDALGTCDTLKDDAQKSMYCTCGDLDVVGKEKVSSIQKQIALGKKGICRIVVQDPDSVSADNLDDNESDCHELWNWPRHVAQSIKVIVYTSGDIVALLLDGKLIGRKLAGKSMDYRAVFKTNFYPGTLEAISYHKGSEHKRATLESVLHPKSTKLTAGKTISAGEYAYVDVAVVDKQGRVVPYASTELNVEVTGEGAFVCAQNTDPKGARKVTHSTINAYDGHATLAVQGTTPGKVQVKVTGEGLSASKLNIKVK